MTYGRESCLRCHDGRGSLVSIIRWSLGLSECSFWAVCHELVISSTYTVPRRPLLAELYPDTKRRLNGAILDPLLIPAVETNSAY